MQPCRDVHPGYPEGVVISRPADSDAYMTQGIQFGLFGRIDHPVLGSQYAPGTKSTMLLFKFLHSGFDLIGWRPFAIPSCMKPLRRWPVIDDGLVQPASARIAQIFIPRVSILIRPLTQASL